MLVSFMALNLGLGETMLSLKTWSAACTLGAFALLGCTHSADLHSQTSLQGEGTLQTHHWQLKNAQNPQGNPDMQWHLPATSTSPLRTVGLRFADNQTLSVDRLCNAAHGSYKIDGEHIQMSRLVSTMMACNDVSLMELEHNVIQQLPKVRSWKIADGPSPTLELHFDSGAVWQLQGTPTYETLYGRSERIFLEVAPQKVACSHPLIPHFQCLQVRELIYNPQGIKQSAGVWGNYYGNVEGYGHQAGVRNVLRIKRFTRPQTPVDASKHIDVLDMVVESEIVP